MSTEIVSFQSLLPRYRAIFFDAFGVLRGPAGLIAGVDGVLSSLGQKGPPFWLITNSASYPPAYLASQYGDFAGKPLMSIPQVISSGMFFSQAVKAPEEGALALYLGQPKSEHYLLEAGFEPIRVENLAMLSSAQIQKVKAFALMDSMFDWKLLMSPAINFLRRHPHLPLYCPNPDLVFYGGEDRVEVGPGALAQMMGQILGREFRSFGKPDAKIFELAFSQARLQIPDLKPSEVLMVGDNLLTDVLGAQSLGIDSVLVLSGNTTLAMLETEIKRIGATPTFIARSIAT